MIYQHSVPFAEQQRKEKMLYANWGEEQANKYFVKVCILNAVAHFVHLEDAQDIISATRKHVEENTIGFESHKKAVVKATDDYYYNAIAYFKEGWNE